ncbi:MAG: hypothetical protein ACKV2V_17675 [Blastocatellia bacterium]
MLHDYETGQDELYDLARDPGERYDLAAVNQRRARTLRTKLDAALKKVNARVPPKMRSNPSIPL